MDNFKNYKELNNKRINFMASKSIYQKLCSIAEVQKRSLASVLRKMIDSEFQRMIEYGGK